MHSYIRQYIAYMHSTYIHYEDTYIYTLPPLIRHHPFGLLPCLPLSPPCGHLTFVLVSLFDFIFVFEQFVFVNVKPTRRGF